MLVTMMAIGKEQRDIPKMRNIPPEKETEFLNSILPEFPFCHPFPASVRNQERTAQI